MHGHGRRTADRRLARYKGHDILSDVKIAITLLTILALAVAAFFVGWVELSLPPGTYGVAFTKSGGWDEEAIAPGGITWRWERLIPTNMTLHLFDLTPREVQRRVAALLPSAEVYAAEIGIDPAALSYDLGVTVRLQLRAEHLAPLAATAELRPDTLPAWYEQATAAAADAATGALLAGEAVALVTNPGSLEEGVRRRLSARFPEMEIIDVELVPHSVPDPDLYRHAKTAFDDRVDAQQRARLAVVADLAFMREQAAQHAELLAMLGSTLAEFPELVDLLSRSSADLLGQVLGMAQPAGP